MPGVSLKLNAETKGEHRKERAHLHRADALFSYAILEFMIPEFITHYSLLTTHWIVQVS